LYFFAFSISFSSGTAFQQERVSIRCIKRPAKGYHLIGSIMGLRDDVFESAEEGALDDHAARDIIALPRVRKRRKDRRESNSK